MEADMLRGRPIVRFLGGLGTMLLTGLVMAGVLALKKQAGKRS
jgi:hypothetical protein